MLKRGLVHSEKGCVLKHNARRNQNDWAMIPSLDGAKFSLYVIRLIPSQRQSLWLCSYGCTQRQLAVISVHFRGSPHWMTWWSLHMLSERAGQWGSQRGPRLETALFQHLICFAAAAPFGECSISILFSGFEQAQETVHRVCEEGLEKYFSLADSDMKCKGLSIKKHKGILSQSD